VGVGAGALAAWFTNHRDPVDHLRFGRLPAIWPTSLRWCKLTRLVQEGSPKLRPGQGWGRAAGVLHQTVRRISVLNQICEQPGGLYEPLLGEEPTRAARFPRSGQGLRHPDHAARCRCRPTFACADYDSKHLVVGPLVGPPHLNHGAGTQQSAPHP
jgi:hypothetical protein